MEPRSRTTEPANHETSGTTSSWTVGLSGWVGVEDILERGHKAVRVEVEVRVFEGGGKVKEAGEKVVVEEGEAEVVPEEVPEEPRKIQRRRRSTTTAAITALHQTRPKKSLNH